MNLDKQRMAIAEYCGTMKWSHALPQKTIHYETPYYIQSLDEMHEAEKSLIFSKRQQFYYELQKVKSKGMDGICLVAMSECISATAGERAEAFLRTIGRWEE